MLPNPLPNEELALPSKSTSISYQRAPTVNSTVSDKSILTSPNTPCCLSVLLMSLKKITGSEYGPAENQPAAPLFMAPVEEISVNA